MIWANFVFLLFLSLFPITVQAVSLHPRDSADLAVFCGNVLFCGLALSVLRLAALHDHAADPEFLAWSRERTRLAVVGLGSVLLAAGLSFYSTFAALAVIASILVLVLITG